MGSCVVGGFDCFDEAGNLLHLIDDGDRKAFDPLGRGHSRIAGPQDWILDGNVGDVGEGSSGEGRLAGLPGTGENGYPSQLAARPACQPGLLSSILHSIDKNDVLLLHIYAILRQFVAFGNTISAVGFPPGDTIPQTAAITGFHLQ